MKSLLTKSLYAKHAQYSLGKCNFPFQVRSLWGCKIMFLVKEAVPSNKWCSCPSRAQLEFFDRSVTNLHNFTQTWCDWKDCYIFSSHGVTFKDAADSILVSKRFPSNNVVPSKQMAAGFLWKECYIFLKKWCYFQTWRPAELLWEECYMFKGHSAYFDTILFLLFKLNCLFF